MKLGAFSISLNVKDIQKSKTFYEKLGFTSIGGDINQKWLILKNEHSTIGLFENMLPKNTLTFNPGWNQEGENIDNFKDIRTIEKELINSNILEDLQTKTTQGPAHILIEDPDGNPILIDQHR